MNELSKEPQLFNVVMLVAYKGTNYAGFQRQDHATSVQGCLEQAISKVANHPVETFCAGRTDAGVHGTNQVINFVTTASRPEHGWLRGTNTHLPKDIRVVACKIVPQDFHARFSAVFRRYRYVILENTFADAHLEDSVTCISYPLNVELMQEAAQHLLGEQDFKSFQAARCQATTSNRCIHHAKFYRQGNFLVFDIQANAFLYHMVRNIMGALLKVGKGELSPQEFKALIEAKNRNLAPATAPANGLYLVEVGYPEEYSMLKPSFIGPSFLLD
ncbi:tRNA pseudouridine(38-40) synthase TruA [Psittacicella melopsittaci]|uniref:tRNA pseudouridine synthase A n=1 Tax=Psittacicella melopsittaci TaxID=2028576 RepID=A0A3A1Y1F6_9GAMM|nr:tRNA pseudouridine(38-40) synthase TruA [Psittacicella melopsittaci]RIY32073.1 tRNA pseudouridine(38-40) synthase TruA [Psittacicella melopsittaci]